MIKIVSFVAFIAAFISTWFLFHSSDKISQVTHAGIQSKLMLLIEQTIKSAKPNSNNFEILNIYTEKIDDNQVSAHFTYKFTDQLEDKEPVNQTLSGEAILYRGLSENPNDEKWVAKSIKTNGSVIEFQQGLIISPEPGALSPSGDNTLIPEEKKTH